MKKLVLDQRLIDNFKRLNGVVLEQNLFGNKEIQSLTKKFNDVSDETISKLQVFALFRNVQPFNTINDINNLNSLGELNDLIDVWKERTIQTIQKNTRMFIDGEQLTHLNDVLNWFIKNANKFNKPFSTASLQDLDNTLLDIYTEHTKKTIEISKDEKSLHNPESDDIIHEDKNVVVVSGSTMGRCVMYGKGNTWCISRTDTSNMFQSYRYVDQATIYFVLLKTRPEGDVERELVILNYPRGYGIADKTNKGTRSGSQSDAVKWPVVEKEIPELRGLEGVFESNPPTEDEIKYSRLVRENTDESDFYKFVINNTRNLFVEGTKITTTTFIRDYMNNKGSLTDPQFKSLWVRRNNKIAEGMILEYLKTGKAITEQQFNLISSDE